MELYGKASARLYGHTLCEGHWDDSCPSLRLPLVNRCHVTLTNGFAFCRFFGLLKIQLVCHLACDMIFTYTLHAARYYPSA